MRKQTCKLLLFDLDGTLLQSDKTISKRTLSVLRKCREKGILIGVSTSRSEQNFSTTSIPHRQAPSFQHYYFHDT